MATSDLTKAVFKEALVFAKSVEQYARNEVNKRIETENAGIEQHRMELLEKERNLQTKTEAFEADSSAFVQEINRVAAISKSLKEKETCLTTRRAKLQKDTEKISKKRRQMVKEANELAKAKECFNRFLMEKQTEFDRKTVEFQEKQARKETELNRKASDVQEMLDGLRAKEEQINAKDQKLAVEEELRQNFVAKNNARETKLKQREEEAENKIRQLAVEKEKVLKLMKETEDEMQKRKVEQDKTSLEEQLASFGCGWMSIDDFLKELTRLEMETQFPSETVFASRAINRLLRNLQESNKIVNGMIKVANKSSFSWKCLTLGTFAEDKTIESIKPLVTPSSQQGLNITLRELHNSLLEMVRSQPAEKKEILNAELRALHQEGSRLTAEKENLAREKSKIASEKDQLSKEKRGISLEKESLAKDKRMIALEKEDLVKEKKKIASDQEGLAIERKEIADKAREERRLLDETEAKLKKRYDQLKERRSYLDAREQKLAEVKTTELDLKCKLAKLEEEKEKFEKWKAEEESTLRKQLEKLTLQRNKTATPNPMEELASRGWMRIGDFFDNLSRLKLKSNLNVSESTLSALSKLLERLQSKRKIVDGMIIIHQNATCITLGNLAEDGSATPLFSESSPDGFDSTLRTLYNTLLSKVTNPTEGYNSVASLSSFN